VSHPHFLTCVSTYSSIHCGLFYHNQCIDSFTINSRQSSRDLICSLDTLLKNNSVSLEQCAFIAASQGPAPFTTLRSVLATINGLAYAARIPLVGLDSLPIFLEEYYASGYDYTLALFNAFSGDVYYGIMKNPTPPVKNPSLILSGVEGCSEVGSKGLESGCLSLELCIEHIKTIIGTSSLACIGGGVTLHQEILAKNFPHAKLCINLEYASLNALGKKAYEQWCNKENITRQLTPLYLKALKLH